MKFFLARIAMLLALTAFVFAVPPPSLEVPETQKSEQVTASPRKGIGSPTVSEETIPDIPADKHVIIPDKPVDNHGTIPEITAARPEREPMKTFLHHDSSGRPPFWSRFWGALTALKKTRRRNKANKEMKSMLQNLPADDQINPEMEQFTGRDTIIFGREAIQLPNNKEDSRHMLAALFRNVRSKFYARDRYGQIWQFERSKLKGLHRHFLYRGNLEPDVVNHINYALREVDVAEDIAEHTLPATLIQKARNALHV